MYKIIIILCISFLISGCNNKGKSNNIIKNSTAIEHNSTSINTENKNESTNAKNEKKLLKELKKAIPNAQIIGNAMKDLDNDGNKDLIVIFNRAGKNEEVNFSVVTNRSINAIKLSDSKTHIQFAYGPDSLKLSKATNVFTIKTFNMNTTKYIDFQITMEFNKKLNKTNFKIVSKDVKH